jgi:hypothetical protein
MPRSDGVVMCSTSNASVADEATGLNNVEVDVAEVGIGCQHRHLGMRDVQRRDLTGQPVAVAE